MSKNHIRNRAIKLAYENPKLRAKLLPLIQKLSGEKAKTEEGAKKLFEKYMDGLTPEGRKNTKKKPQDFYEKPSKDDAKSEGGAKSDPLGKLELSGKIKQKVKDLVKELIQIIHNPKDEYGDKDFKEEVYDLIKENSPMFSHSDQDIKDAVDALLSNVKKKKPDAKKPDAKKPDAKKPRENGELPIGDKGQQKRKQMSKADKVKAYQEAIKNSKSMSPEDKKKALEKSKKPGFDADAALGAMGDEDEEDGGKTASLRSQVIKLAHDHPELRADLLPLLKSDGEALTKTGSDAVDLPLRDLLNKATETWVEAFCAEFSKQVYSKYGISSSDPVTLISNDLVVGVVHGEARIDGKDHNYQAQIKVNPQYGKMRVEWEFGYGDPDSEEKESWDLPVAHMTPQKAAEQIARNI